MSKTQANEPGFVQLPDGWLAIEMKAAEAEIAKWPDGLRASFESLLCQTAPPVPSPAYGGLRALEWLRVPLTEFSSSAKTEVGTYRTWTHHEANGEWYWSFCGPAGGAVIDGEGRSEAEVQAAAQADYERRVLSCLSPVAVEEADAKAGEPGLVTKLRADVDRLSGLVLKSSNDVDTFWKPQCADLRARGEALETALRRSQRALIALPGASLEVADCIAANRAMLSAAPSTPSPQTEADRILLAYEQGRRDALAGKAGAGPVGDATDAMIEAGLKVDMTNEDEVAFLHNVWHAMVAAHPAGAGPVGEAEIWQCRLSAHEAKDEGWYTVSKETASYVTEHGHLEGQPDLTCAVRPLYAHLVNEPGEVEREAGLMRLTSELANALQRADSAEAKWSSPGSVDNQGLTVCGVMGAVLSYSIGDLYPRAEWRRPGLYQPSMKLKTAMRACALVGNLRRSSSSHSSVAKKLSHMALS